MEMQKMHWLGIITALIIVAGSFFFIGQKIFFLIIGIGVVIGVAPFVGSMILETKISREKEEMFLEFSRNLVEGFKAGTPISKSIINARNKPYGSLSPHVKKLANQIALGIPIKNAFQIFADDIGNRTISKAITLIGEAEKAGGEINEILEAVAEAVSEVDKLKKERRAAIYSLVVQSYIIFAVFLIIIVIMQFKILPMMEGITSLEKIGAIENIRGGGGTSSEEISQSFFYLLLIQGFFSGLITGKLAEGSIKAGIKHSFILMLSAFLVSAGAKLFI